MNQLVQWALDQGWSIRRKLDTQTMPPFYIVEACGTKFMHASLDDAIKNAAAAFGVRPVCNEHITDEQIKEAFLEWQHNEGVCHAKRYTEYVEYVPSEKAAWKAAIAWFKSTLALRPSAQPAVPAESDAVFDLICNAIDKADTISMEGDYMLDSDDCIAVVRVMQALLSAAPAAQPAIAPAECVHVLYETHDTDRPKEICDGNGEVVLAMCKLCGKAEAELIDSPCATTAQPASPADMAVYNQIASGYPGASVPAVKRECDECSITHDPGMCEQAAKHVGEPVAVVDGGCLMFTCDGPLPDGTRLYTGPTPLPEHADNVPDIAARLRLVAKLAGCPDAVPQDDEIAVGAIFAVLGNMRFKLERLPKPAPQPVAVPDRVPMTEEDVEEIERAIWPGIQLDSTDRAVNRQFVRAVETHHKIGKQNA